MTISSLNKKELNFMPRSTFYVNEKVQVSFQPNIGLDASARHSVVEIFNIILADESVLLLKPIARKSIREESLFLI